MVFVADGQVGVGAVREVRADSGEVVVNIENAGDFVLPMSAIRDVHSGKVMLDVDALDPPVREALRHLHDSEFPVHSALDPADGAPDE